MPLTQAQRTAITADKTALDTKIGTFTDYVESEGFLTTTPLDQTLARQQLDAMKRLSSVYNARLSIPEPT